MAAVVALLGPARRQGRSSTRPASIRELPGQLAAIQSYISCPGGTFWRSLRPRIAHRLRHRISPASRPEAANPTARSKKAAILRSLCLPFQATPKVAWLAYQPIGSSRRLRSSLFRWRGFWPSRPVVLALPPTQPPEQESCSTLAVVLQTRMSALEVHASDTRPAVR